ncbi:MAG: DnaB-like helicase N-terminal domain-containing protein, partial [Deinococcota bacterium]
MTLAERNPTPESPFDFTSESPFNIKAEECVITSLLLDQEQLADVEDMLEPTHFYIEKHRRFYKAILSLWRKQEIIDSVTLLEELRTTNQVESDDFLNIARLMMDYPGYGLAVGQYATIVRRDALRREMIQVSKQLHQLARDAENATDLVDKAESVITQATQSYRIGSKFSDMPEIVGEIKHYIH